MSKPKIHAIIQARCSSSRLPAKVMLPLAGHPMLAFLIQRVQQSGLITKITVATSTQAEDDAIESLCRNLGLTCYRGDLHDVLSRFYGSAQQYPSQHLVRLTADCPLLDPDVIDRVIETHLTHRNDYTSNCLEPTYPDGLDVEVFTRESLNTAYQQARLPSEREHVTPFIHKHPELFKIETVKHSEDLSHLRLTVDHPEDLQLVRLIAEKLFPAQPDFKLADIIALLRSEPDLLQINQQYQRNEGYLKSLEQDKDLIK